MSATKFDLRVLSCAKLAVIGPGDLPSKLRTLHVHNCGLKQIFLNDHVHLRYVDVSHNEIEHLTDDMLPPDAEFIFANNPCASL